MTAHYDRDPDLGARKPLECDGCGRPTAGRLIKGTERTPLCEKCSIKKGIV